jgi:hypothetical protein
MDIPTLVAEEAANLPVPDVTDVAGRLRTVDVTVSSVLAVRYVPPYSMKMRKNGLEKKMDWGRSRRVRSEDRIELARVFRPEAFSMIDLKHRVRYEQSSNHTQRIWKMKLTGR